MRLFLVFISLFLISVTGVQAATFTVTKTADTNDGTCDADCSLREAVVAANANAGADTIEFNIPTSDGGYVPASGDVHDYWSIEIGSNLTLTDDDGVFINGYSQTGASRNTASFGEELDTIIKIQIQGGDYHLRLLSNNNRISGINAWRLSSAVVIRGDNIENNWIEGNFLGTTINGDEARGGGAIQIHGSSNNNTLGTNGDGILDNSERNLLLGNSDEIQGGNLEGLIYFSGTQTGNKVSGNYFGVDKTGNKCAIIGYNRLMHHFTGSKNGFVIGTNYDGVSDEEEANLFGCVNDPNNTMGMIHFLGWHDGFVQGNFFGTNPQGTVLNSKLTRGMRFFSTVSNNTLIKGNVIANTGAGGITVENTSVGLAIRENIIFSSSGLGVDLADDRTLQTNDPADTDTGPNDLMNHPVILKAEYRGGDKYHLFANLDGNPSEAPYTIEVCQSSNHSSGYGGCVKTLKTFTIQERGNFEVDVTLETNNLDNLPSFTMLATNANGSTSEFGPNYQATQAGPIPEPIIYQPDIRPSQGGLTHKPEISTITLSETFAWDVYLDHQIQRQVGAYRIPGTRYWQAGDVHQLWWRSYFNQARVMPELIARPYILVMRYDRNRIDPNLPETNLRMAYSADEGQSWRILPGTVHSMETQTVATVTKQGGHFMLVSGY